MPVARKTRKPTAETVMAPASFQDERTQTPAEIRTGNAVQHMEVAKNLAYVQARVRINSIIRTKNKSYRVMREVDKGVFSYLYEVKQKEGENEYMVTEPITANRDMERFKTLKLELVILRNAMKSERSDTMHFPRLKDSGCTEEFKFLIMQGLGESLYDITRKQMKSAFSMSTALRVAIQMLRSLMDLHALGFLHRSLRPNSFFTGARTSVHVRTVYMTDFGLPYRYRDAKTKKIRKPRKHVRMMGTLRYMSRNAQLNKEHARRDDLESWAYVAMEFFDLNILPWRNDQVNSEVLHKKQKTVDGSFPMMFTTITLRFKTILRYITNMKFHEHPDYNHIQTILQEIRAEKEVDFTIPYDWELFKQIQDVVGINPASVEIPAQPQSSLTVTPQAEMKEKDADISSDDDPSSPVPLPTASVEPAEVKPTKSVTIAPSGDSKVEIGVNPVLLEKVVEIDMANNCVNMAENKALRALLEKNRNKMAEKAGGVGKEGNKADEKEDSDKESKANGSEKVEASEKAEKSEKSEKTEGSNKSKKSRAKLYEDKDAPKLELSEEMSKSDLSKSDASAGLSH